MSDTTSAPTYPTAGTAAPSSSAPTTAAPQATPPAPEPQQPVQLVQVVQPTQQHAWIQNMSSDASVFRGTLGKFRMEGAGYVGSVIQVERPIVFDPYVQRSIQRGRVRVIDEQEAMRIMQSLVIKEDVVEQESILASMSEGASERTGRYTKPGLPDEAEIVNSWTPEEIWGNRPGAPKTEDLIADTFNSANLPDEAGVAPTNPAAMPADLRPEE